MLARFFIFFLLLQPALAAGALLISRDGQNTLRATPVGLVGEKIRFEKENGGEFVAGVEFFSKADQQKLRAWSQALKKSPARQLARQVAKSRELRVLFIGNSYSFQIPALLEKIARSEGHKITVAQVTSGGWTLRQHAASEKTLNKIKSDRWDIIVLQEQSQIPSFPEEQRRQIMDEGVGILLKAARDVDATPTFFLTWGRRGGIGKTRRGILMRVT